VLLVAASEGDAQKSIRIKKKFKKMFLKVDSLRSVAQQLDELFLFENSLMNEDRTFHCPSRFMQFLSTKKRSPKNRNLENPKSRAFVLRARRQQHLKQVPRSSAVSCEIFSVRWKALLSRPIQ
jgi:hypothetical protein